jgi:hypothetical protein
MVCWGKPDEDRMMVLPIEDKPRLQDSVRCTIRLVPPVRSGFDEAPSKSARARVLTHFRTPTEADAAGGQAGPLHGTSLGGDPGETLAFTVNLVPDRDYPVCRPFQIEGRLEDLEGKTFWRHSIEVEQVCTGKEAAPPAQARTPARAKTGRRPVVHH